MHSWTVLSALHLIPPETKRISLCHHRLSLSGEQKFPGGFPTIVLLPVLSPCLQVYPTQWVCWASLDWVPQAFLKGNQTVITELFYCICQNTFCGWYSKSTLKLHFPSQAPVSVVRNTCEHLQGKPTLKISCIKNRCFHKQGSVCLPSQVYTSVCLKSFGYSLDNIIYQCSTWSSGLFLSLRFREPATTKTDLIARSPQS